MLFLNCLTMLCDFSKFQVFSYNIIKIVFKEFLIFLYKFYFFCAKSMIFDKPLIKISQSYVTCMSFKQAFDISLFLCRDGTTLHCVQIRFFVPHENGAAKLQQGLEIRWFWARFNQCSSKNSISWGYMKNFENCVSLRSCTKNW